MRLFSFIIFVFFFAMESCNSLYVPATPSTPVFVKGNSLKASSSLSVDGLNLNLDYSPFNHFYFGGNAHGYYGTYNNHLNGSGYAGIYFNLPDSLIHLNFQSGYVQGSADWTDNFVGSDFVLGSASTIYHTTYVQAFCALHPHEKNQLGFGLRYDFYRAAFNAVYPRDFSSHIPGQAGIPMAFAFGDFGFKKHPAFKFNLFLGINIMLVKSYAGIQTYFPYYVRMGISYQLHFGKK